jgi:hypothetical protein
VVSALRVNLELRFIQNFVFKGYAFRVVFLEPCFRGVGIREDLEVIGVAKLLAGVDVDPDCVHEALKAAAGKRRSIDLLVQRFVLRDYLADACFISANTILCIFCNLMPLRRDQKLFPHLGEAGTAVFAVQEVE